MNKTEAIEKAINRGNSPKAVIKHVKGNVWAMEQKRFGTVHKWRQVVEFDDSGKPILGEKEFHIYRQRMEAKGEWAGRSAPIPVGVPEYLGMVLGHKAMREALKDYAKPGYKVYQQTTRRDGKNA